jgi:hypothetical protein
MRLFLLILDCMVQFEEYIPVMNILLWILQGVLAVINAMHGWLYVTWSPATDQRMQQRNPGTTLVTNSIRWGSTVL